MRNKLILLGLFALFGVLLLRGGITGYVISQSCCFRPDCAPEYQCPVTNATLEKPALLSPEDNNALSIIGLLLTITSVLMISGYIRRRLRKEKKRDVEQIL